MLGILLNNCRTSIREIGRKTGKTNGTVSSRIRKMQNDGLIEEFLIKIEPPMYGYDVVYFVVPGEDMDYILTQIRQIGEPYFVMPCIGGVNVCSIIVKDRINEKIEMANKMIKDIEILFILKADDAHISGFKKADLKVVEELVKNPREKIDMIVHNTGYGIHKVERSIARLEANSMVQFTLAYNPKKFENFVHHIAIVQVVEEENIQSTLKDLNDQFSEQYLQIPFVVKDQIMLFMYSDGIFKMDETTYAIRSSKNVKSTHLVIPKKILRFNNWLKSAMKDAEKIPKRRLRHNQM